jgi:hypothetical protein
MAQNEDIPYNVSDHAIEDVVTDDGDAELSAEVKLVKKIRAYLKKAIGKSESTTVLNLPTNATPEQKIAVFDEIAIHKGVAMHLRNVEEIINNMVKE